MKRTANLKLQQVYSQGAAAERLHLRNDLHLARKAWHMIMGMVIAFIYLGGLPLQTSLLILAGTLAFALGLEIARLKNPFLNEKVVRLWGPLMRHSEVSRFSGVPSYLAAMLIAIAVFPKPVAVLSILYLACGDPIASFVGILYGDRGMRFSNGKSLIGTLAGVGTCVMLGLIFLGASGFPAHATLILGLIGGVAGGTAEHLPVEMDDNFTIPVVSGFVLWLTYILLGL